MVAPVLAAGSAKAAAHRLGLSHSTVKHNLASARSKVGATTTAHLVWILGPRLPEPEGLDHSPRPVQESARSASCPPSSDQPLYSVLAGDGESLVSHSC